MNFIPLCMIWFGISFVLDPLACNTYVVIVFKSREVGLCIYTFAVVSKFTYTVCRGFGQQMISITIPLPLLGFLKSSKPLSGVTSNLKSPSPSSLIFGSLFITPSRTTQAGEFSTNLLCSKVCPQKIDIGTIAFHDRKQVL